jgi:hypothetical protein
LNTNRDHEELYHEEYDTVAVMFASLTEYALWDDNGFDGFNELNSIRLLNQIICDFDKVNIGYDIKFYSYSVQYIVIFQVMTLCKPVLSTWRHQVPPK